MTHMKTSKTTLLSVIAVAALNLSTHIKPAQAFEPFIGQIIMFGGTFAPRGWALAEGQLLPISSYSALFSILGTTFGGDGRTTFGLPDLRGRVPMGAGRGAGLSFYRLGQKGGVETVTLTTLQMPSHNHIASTTATLKATSDAGHSDAPTANILANDGGDRIYKNIAPNVNMSPAAISANTIVSNNGGSQPHTNIQPYQVVNFIIALQGTYPSRN